MTDHASPEQPVTESKWIDPHALTQEFQSEIWRYLRFLGCDASSADDLTQETLLAVLKKPFEDLGRQATSAYLRTTARNLFLQTVRDAKKSPVIAHPEIAEAAWQKFAQNSGGNQYLQALQGCVKKLQGKAKQAIEQRYQHNQSRTQMAQELEMSEEGVKTLLRRTRDQLRDCVQGNLPS